MSVLQGSTLESVVSLEDLAEWKRNKTTRPSLISLHEKFWGKSIADDQPPMPLEGMEEEDDVIEGCCFLELNIEGLLTSRIWIRAEYIRIYEAVESWYKEAYNRAPAAVITGQPGIGKRMWIYYALCRRLVEMKPVIWYLNGRRYLFVQEGVFQAPRGLWTFEFQPFVWTLVDSDEGRDGVPERLVPHLTRHFVIYCTSPNQQRWSRLHKTVLALRFTMNPWKSGEILRVIDDLPPETKVDPGRAIDIFNKLGPTPRLCIDYLRSPTIMEQYEESLTEAISALTPSDLQELFRKSKSLSMDTLPHKICLISRQDGENAGSPAIVSPITSHIASRLVNHLRTQERRQQIRLYKHFSKVNESRKVAGIFFETAAQRYLQDGVDLKFIPMVRPASSASGNPQWHSSHHAFRNKKLERSRKQALKNGQPLRIPKDPKIVEYAKNGPSSRIRSATFYVPESTNQVAFDSFIITNNILYIFQFTIGGKHEIKSGLIDFFRQRERPPMENWRFIFVLPPNHELLCPQPRGSELQNLQPYSVVVDLDKWQPS